MTPKTIGESIDIYRTQLAERGFEGGYEGWEMRNYPHDNHRFTMKADSQKIRTMFEESGQFKLYLENPSPGIPYSMELVKPLTLVIPKPQDAFSVNFSEFHKMFGDGWTGLTIHPRSYPNQSYIDSIDALEKILLIAEKHKVPMATQHKDGDSHTSSIVTYYPENF